MHESAAFIHLYTSADESFMDMMSAEDNGGGQAKAVFLCFPDALTSEDLHGRMISALKDRGDLRGLRVC